jgi:hypothetical protein
MENQTGFYLEAAIECWRQELLAQPSLSSADRSELETHLRDAIAGLHGLGLSDEEAFIIARRRAGPAQQIAEEFFKADPARVWRERVFWMAAVLLLMNVWGGTTNLLVMAMREYTSPQSSINSSLTTTVVYWLFFHLPLLCLAVFLSFGLVAPEFKWMRSVFSSRARFIKIAAITVLTIQVLTIAVYWHEFTRLHVTGAPAMIAWDATNSIWPLALVALIAWLMPGRNRNAPRLA